MIGVLSYSCHFSIRHQTTCVRICSNCSMSDTAGLMVRTWDLWSNGHRFNTSPFCWLWVSRTQMCAPTIGSFEQGLMQVRGQLMYYYQIVYVVLKFAYIIITYYHVIKSSSLRRIWPRPNIILVGTGRRVSLSWAQRRSSAGCFTTSTLYTVKGWKYFFGFCETFNIKILHIQCPKKSCNCRNATSAWS